MRRVALAAEVIATYLRVAWWRQRGDIPAAVAAARTGSGAPWRGGDPYEESVRLGFAVTRVLRLMPGDSRCLARSLVLTAMLARRGIDSSIVIGVRPGPGFGSHAWVEHGGRPLLAAGPREYRRLVEL
jgi:transglutaminase superfamily protein